MIGAHLDSWTGATGATDNAAGAAVMIEALRILTAAGLKPRRTIRLALWGGHEGEGLGSTAYVRTHFGSAAAPTPLHRKVSCYFNLDNGTGRIRGIYLQNNDALRPIFERWFEPFTSLGASTVSINAVGGTDHGAFDAAGIPGFQFIQDPVEYATRTHHTNMDHYDRLQEADLKQASAIVASFAYFAANRDEPLPRQTGK
jgi:Zn-dependent M28 family amino/carboxypeptidase